MHSPVISEPISISGVISTSDKGESSNIGGNAPVISHVSQGVMGLSTLSDANANNGIEEQAAIKAQAAFRGYLVTFCNFYILVHVCILLDRRTVICSALLDTTIKIIANRILGLLHSLI